MANLLPQELVFLVLDFLDHEKYQESKHTLERESGYFFDMNYFEEKVLAADWDVVEKYLSGFTNVNDNAFSVKLFFELRKQKYLEALDMHDRAEAVEILRKDLKVFAMFNENLYKDVTQLLVLDNFRQNEQLSEYRDIITQRTLMLEELKRLIAANPKFQDKLVVPTVMRERLRTLINRCTPVPRVAAPLPHPVGAVAMPVAYAPLRIGSHGHFPPRATAANANALAVRITNGTVPSSAQSALVDTSSIPVLPNQVPIWQLPRAPSSMSGMVDYPTTIYARQTEHLSSVAQPSAQPITEEPGMVDHPSTIYERLMERLSSVAQPSAQPITEESGNYSAPQYRQRSWSMDDLPRRVVRTFHQGSSVTSIDFHPFNSTLILVGSKNGEITLWEIGVREKLVSKPFNIWDMTTCSTSFQVASVEDPSISISRVAWSPEGNLLGIAFTKHLIHLYAFEGPNKLHQLLEIDAHVGGVNDLAFTNVNKQLYVLTCGDDKMIKVWDLSGQMVCNFEGHTEPIYSVFPHRRREYEFFFSTSIDGKIKIWLYNAMGSEVDYNAPGQGCTKILYSADGIRLFSCGTSKEGMTFLIEWDEEEGTIKRTYSGFQTKSPGVVQFDTAQNHFLAAGDNHQIKFWDMDNVNILTSTEAEGGLPSCPCLRFNKEGNLLAVSTSDNGFKILANTVGLESLRVLETRSIEGLRAQNESSGTKIPSPAVMNVSPAICNEEQLDRHSPERPSPICIPSPAVMNVSPAICNEEQIDRHYPERPSPICIPSPTVMNVSPTICNEEQLDRHSPERPSPICIPSPAAMNVSPAICNEEQIDQHSPKRPSPICIPSLTVMNDSPTICNEEQLDRHSPERPSPICIPSPTVMNVSPTICNEEQLDRHSPERPSSICIPSPAVMNVSPAICNEEKLDRHSPERPSPICIPSPAVMNVSPAICNEEQLDRHSPERPSPICIPSPAVMNVSPAICNEEQLYRHSPERPSPICKGVDPTIRTIEKSRTLEDPCNCQEVTMPGSGDPATTYLPSKIARLVYTHSGGGILTLGSDGILKLWKWSSTDQNPSGKATASVVPQHWQPMSGLWMINDVSEVDLKEAVPCMALSNNDAYVMSACGGQVLLFNMLTFKVLTTLTTPPPAPTFLAFHPQDNNVLSIGMEDSTIHIYHITSEEVKVILKAHQKRITGLAFSTSLNILVSSCADDQLCTWSTDTWEKKNTISVQVPAGKVATCQTQFQFHSDLVRLLVFHETQLAIYDASTMECIHQWVPGGVQSASVSCAAYSCNSQVVFAAFYDGNVGVFDAESLRLRCLISPEAYLSPEVLNSQHARILAIATHPEEPNQFAIGMTDGSVKVLEPSKSDEWWVVAAPSENGRKTVPSENGIKDGSATAPSENGIEEDVKTTAPSESVTEEDGMKAAVPSENGIEEDVKTTAPWESVTEEDGMKAAAPSENGIEEDVKTTAPSESVTEEDGMKAAAPSENGIEEDVKTTAPSESVTEEDGMKAAAPSENGIEEDVKTTAPSESVTEEDGMKDAAPSENGIEEDVKTTAPLESGIEGDGRITAPSEKGIEKDGRTTAPSENGNEDGRTTAPLEHGMEEDGRTAAPLGDGIEEDGGITASGTSKDDPEQQLQLEK